MCVIIEKIANKEVPYSDLLAASHRNPDGWGVVVADGSKAEITKGLSKYPTGAADAVAEVLQRAKDSLAFVHFRYRTVGEITPDNAQPITVLRKNAGDEADMVFMHNGTLSRFKARDNKSDSLVFAETVVEPLVRRSVSYMGADRVLEDPLIAEILSHYGENVSKFAMIDDAGNSLVVNRGKGVEREYGWASNGYSLQSENISRYEEKTQKRKVYSSSWPPSKENIAFDMELNRNSAQNNTVTSHPAMRVTVKEATGFDLEDFEYLDHDQVRELIDEEPDLAALLILDYAYALKQTQFTHQVAA